jgi:hypothetical protein
MPEDKRVLDDFTKNNLLLIIERPTTLAQKSRRALFWNGGVKGAAIRSYVRHLERYGIVIGDGTRRELQEQGTAPSPSSTPSDSFEEETAEKTAEETAEEETAAAEAGRNEEDDILSPLLAKAVQNFQDLSICRSPPTSSARRTLHFETMASSDEPSSGATAYPQGSRCNPYVIKVDIKFPENNREFEVTFIPRIILSLESSTLGGAAEAFVFERNWGSPTSTIMKLRCTKSLPTTTPIGPFLSKASNAARLMRIGKDSTVVKTTANH